MATKKKEEELAAPEAQSGYDTSGLENRQQVEEAMAGAGYRPGQSVTNAANALKEWQDKRPEAYQSSYQDRINEVLDRLLARENFAYSYTQDPLYRQYAQQYTQNAHNASADAAAQAAALTGGYGSSYAASAAQQAYQQQIGALNEAIPSLYSLALDTYTSGGDELVSRLDQLNAQEQSAQEQYDRQLSDYYTQLQQKGEDYNNAYAQDYGQYQDYLSRLDTLHGYYTAQEQAQGRRCGPHGTTMRPSAPAARRAASSCPWPASRSAREVSSSAPPSNPIRSGGGQSGTAAPHARRSSRHSPNPNTHKAIRPEPSGR